MASWYNEILKDTKLVLPYIAEGFVSSWAQYTVQLPNEIDRDKVQADLKKKEIPTMVYYKKPMHRQFAFVGTRSADAECPNTEMLCETVLSLPMHPYITREEVQQVAEALIEVIQ